MGTKNWVTIGIGSTIIVVWLVLLSLRMSGVISSADSSDFSALSGLAYAAIAAITSITTGVASFASRTKNSIATKLKAKRGGK